MSPNFDLILSTYSLGTIIDSPQLITSGLTNQVYYIKTTTGEFALKIISQTSSRARTPEAYEIIETYAQSLIDTDIPTISAVKNKDNHRVTQLNGMYCFIYKWQNAETCYFPVDHVHPLHAYGAGTLLGKIHSTQINCPAHISTLEVNFDTSTEELTTLIATGLDLACPWEKLLNENSDALLEINRKCLLANARLSRHLFSHGDFMPHNLMWPTEETINQMPILIDWELGGFVNPGVELVMALLSHSHFSDPEQFSQTALEHFMQGYYNAGASLKDSISDAIYGAINKGWVNWIVFNMRRSINSNDEQEKKVASDIVCHVLPSLIQIVEQIPRLETMITEYAATLTFNRQDRLHNTLSIIHSKDNLLTLSS